VSRVEQVLRGAAADLNAHGARWAVVGGLAVSARVEPRFTRDADIAVGVPDDAAAEALVHALVGVGYSPLASVEQQAAGRLAAVRLAPPGEPSSGVVLDLLFASSGIEQEVVAQAEHLIILPGLTLPVARAGHLIALKVLARDDQSRPQDHQDLVALIREAPDSEIARARDALATITARGFHRGRLLGESLERVLQEVRG